MARPIPRNFLTNLVSFTEADIVTQNKDGSMERYIGDCRVSEAYVSIAPHNYFVKVSMFNDYDDYARAARVLSLAVISNERFEELTKSVVVACDLYNALRGSVSDTAMARLNDLLGYLDTSFSIPKQLPVSDVEGDEAVALLTSAIASGEVNFELDFDNFAASNYNAVKHNAIRRIVNMQR